MNLPPNDSALWPTLRFSVIAMLLTMMLALNYKSFDGRDIVTILTVLAGLAGFDATKYLAKKSERDADKEDDA